MDVAASEFYDNKGKTYDLNFKEEVDNLQTFSQIFFTFFPLCFFIKCFNLVTATLLQNNDGSQKISGDSLKNVYKSFVTDYPIVSIEDPFDQDDWEHYAKLTAEVGQQVQIVGDDLLVTNPKVCFICFNFVSHVPETYILEFWRYPVHYWFCSVWKKQLRRSLAMPCCWR